MKIAALAIVALFFVGCGGGGGSGGPEDLGEACGDVAEVWCERARACFPEDAPTQETCVNEFMDTCCMGNDSCDYLTSEEITDDEWSDCVSSYDDLSCTEIQSGVLPDACAGM